MSIHASYQPPGVEKYITLGEFVKNKVKIDDLWPDKCRFFTSGGLLVAFLGNERYIFNQKAMKGEQDRCPDAAESIVKQLR